MSAPLTYASYLRLDTLLDLQTPRSQGPAGAAAGAHAQDLPGHEWHIHEGPEHDEMLFIVIHQVYELWFKQMLHELDYLQGLLRAADANRALHTLRRLLTILKTVVSQIDVLETMTPLEFNSFRGFLESASGFQSFQFRELEFVLGHKRLATLHHFPEGSTGRERLERRYAAPTLWDAFLAYLACSGCAVPAEHLARDVTQPVTPSRAIQSLLIEAYRREARGEGGAVSRIAERFVDLDEGIQEWRYRHVKMVERTIGNKRGTGGSAGVGYLRTTLEPLFPDLWAIRAEL